MVHTLIHTPHVLLNEYVLFIGIREFDYEELYKPMHAQHEIHVMFMINCKIHDFINVASNPKKVTLKKRSTPDFGFTGLLRWMDICYKTGYYDPMHLVKDFKKFAAMSPTNLFKNAPPLFEDISVYQVDNI